MSSYDNPVRRPNCADAELTNGILTISVRFSSDSCNQKYICMTVQYVQCKREEIE